MKAKSLLMYAVLIQMGLGLMGCKSEKSALTLQPNDGHIAYQGRVEQLGEEGTKLYWSGTTITLNFEGTSIAAYFKDSEGDNYYDIRIDNDSVGLIRPDTLKQKYVLANNLTAQKHTLEIFKRTEWNRGTTTFMGFEIDGGAKVLDPPPVPTKKLEFYGNSISAGYAVEDYSGKDIPDSTYTNNYYSYDALTARHFNSDTRCICRSGIGITISWDPPIMPEIYDRLNPTDSTSTWDFSQYTPDVVVVNLFQNDSWLVNMPDHEQFKRRFGTQAPSPEALVEAYQNFIAKLRGHYPQAYIICALGSMDATKEGSPWPGYIKQAVQNLNDDRMGVVIFPYKNTENHPTKEEQAVMAQKLIGYIHENLGWE